MTPETKLKVQETLFVYLMDIMFADTDMMGDYVRHGMTFPGLANMSDEELINELIEVVDDDNVGDDYDLLQQAKLEISTQLEWQARVTVVTELKDVTLKIEAYNVMAAREKIKNMTPEEISNLEGRTHETRVEVIGLKVIPKSED